MSTANSTLVNRATLFLAFVTSIAIPSRISGVSVEQSILGVALLTALYVLYHSKEARENVKSIVTSKTGQMLFWVFTLWGISSFFSFNPAKSFEIGGRTGVFILAAAAIGAVLQAAPERHEYMWKVFMCAALGLGSAALASLLGFPEILAALHARIDDLLRGIYPFHPPYILKAYATATVCMLPIVIFAGRYLKQGWQYLGYAYFAIALMVVVLTETRSAMAGFLGVVVVGVGAIAVVQGYFLRAATFAMVVAVVVLAWVRDNRSVYLTNFTDGTYLPGWLIDPHRQQIWKFSFEKFLDHPIVGNGIDQLNRLPGAEQSIPGLGNSAHFVPAHPHNWIMEILSETGLLGFTPVVLVLVYLAYSLATSFLHTRDEGALAQLLLLVAFFTCSLFSFSIWAVWWQLVLYILYAMVYASRQARPHDP